LFYILNFMKNLLKHLPSWESVKMFFNIFYYVVFIIWFLLHLYLMIFDGYQTTNNDLFGGLVFITFLMYDIKDDKEN
jgi:hypothetical protein